MAGCDPCGCLYTLTSAHCAHIQAVGATAIHPLLLLLSHCQGASQQEFLQGCVRTPHSTPSQDPWVPSTSPGRSTSVKPHHGPHGSPSKCPHSIHTRTWTPRKGGVGVQISKFLSETQSSRGLRTRGWPRLPPQPLLAAEPPTPPLVCGGPGPSRGTRLGLISGPAPSPNGLQLHKHSQNSEPALSGADQASAPAFLAPSPPSLGQLLRNSSNWLGIESQFGFSRGGGQWNGRGGAGPAGAGMGAAERNVEAERREEVNKL